MADFKTIDNLGVDISSQYARTQGETKEDLIKESGIASISAKIDVTKPAYRSEYDMILGTRQRYKGWALFPFPSNIAASSLRVFTSHLLPAIRADEFGLLEMDRLRAHQEKKRKDKKTKTSYNYEETIEDEEEEKESSTLMGFIEEVQQLDKNLIAINGRRNQYQKGWVKLIG